MERIKLFMSQLEKAPVDLSGKIPAEIFEITPDENLAVEAPLGYKLNAVLTAGGVVVKGTAWTKISGLCGRCLSQVEQKISCEYTLFYDDAKNEELDITDDVREELMLEFPMIIVCSEDCKGLCPMCKANLNHEKCRCQPKKAAEKFDSPWNQLDDLKLDK